MRSPKRALVGVLGLGLTITGLQLGLAPAAQAVDTTDIQILGTNDFHGRLIQDETQPGQDCSVRTCPAAVLSSAVKSMRTANPNTVFAAAGDPVSYTHLTLPTKRIV